MTLAILRPTTVTEAVLTGSTVAEDPTPEWSPVEVYALDARVHLPAVHRVYQSLVGSNVGNNPLSSPAQWVDVGPTNRWAMFDGALGIASEQVGSIEVSLRPGPADAVVVLGVQASLLRVRLYDSVGGDLVLTREVSMRAGAVSDWWEWTMAPYEFRQQAAVVELPAYLDPVLVITLVGVGDAPARCGELLVGSSTDLGEVQFGATLGIADYSRKETDEFGVTTLVKRANAKKLSAQLRMDALRLSKTYEFLASIQATPIVVLTDPSEDYDALTLYGFVSDFSIDLALPRIHYCTLEVTGLT